MDEKKQIRWFPGLNGLRFMAAALVVIMHVHLNQGRMGLPALPEWPVLLKGFAAVSFFFTLSGFLITYLLLGERAKTGTIHIRNFYLRRVFRIWPLYFIVVTLGMFFYWKLVPALGLDFETNYSPGLAVVLYVFFLANLMNSLYHVGGMLHITWSIAVEEQFYLFWAPLVKRFQGATVLLIIGVSTVSVVISMCNAANLFGLPEHWQVFVHTLQFHYMGIGAGFAYLLYHHKERLLRSPWFHHKGVQAILLSILAAYYLLYHKSVMGEVLTPIPMGLLYAWLIVNVGANHRAIVTFENRVLNYLGKISYGIYMYHMPVVYAVAFLFTKMAMTAPSWLYFPLYYGLTLGLAIAMAAGSYRWLEKPLLALNHSLAASPTPTVSAGLESPRTVSVKR